MKWAFLLERPAFFLTIYMYAFILSTAELIVKFYILPFAAHSVLIAILHARL